MHVCVDEEARGEGFNTRARKKHSWLCLVRPPRPPLIPQQLGCTLLTLPRKYMYRCGHKLISRSQMPRSSQSPRSADRCHGRLPEVSGRDGVSSCPSVRCVYMRSRSQG